MKWVTRERVKVDRVACPWLIRKFIDPEAEFLFVVADGVLAVAEREQAISFDAPQARYTHRDGKCTFEVLIEEFAVQAPGLERLARIVHGADIAEDIGVTAQSAGLKAIAEGFQLICRDDFEAQERQWPLYDALLAWCAARPDS
ncbi:MAG: chromate resistance protein [Chloroflexi bacterium]|nr:chromate resistance protein [Chloroflexota bacterium]